VMGKTLKSKSTYQRTIEHTIHLMLYGILPRSEYSPVTLSTEVSEANQN
ncbi:TetR family transcriptional regulator, partial [Acinetobacter radioresistens]